MAPTAMTGAVSQRRMRSPIEQSVMPQTLAILASASVKPPSGPVTTEAVRNAPAASIAAFIATRSSPVSYMNSFASACMARPSIST